MKKRFLSALSVFLVLALTLTACGGNPGSQPSGGSNPGASGSQDGASKKVVFLSASNRGDDTFVDMIWEALEKARDKYGLDVSIVEMNNDTSIYASTCMDLCASGEWDLIVTGFYQMVSPVTEAIAEYPDQHFLVFDTELDFASGQFGNCCSVEALQNQGSFLAGALAAMLTTSGIEGTNSDKVVGFIGASAGSTIDDFLVGFIEGVNYIDTGITTLYSYSGSFTDTAASKEHALAMIAQGADVMFAVMGAAGLGVAEGALDSNCYAIGVDSDLALEVIGTNPAMAEHIVTSVGKGFGEIIYKMLGDYAEGKLEWGTHSRYGLADGGIYLFDNDQYKAIVPQEIKDRISEIEQKIISGEITVSTAIGVSQDTVNQILAQAAAH